MAFDETGIRGTIKTRLSQGGFIEASAIVYSTLSRLTTYEKTGFFSGGFIEAGTAVFSLLTKHCTYEETRLSGGVFVLLPSVIVFSPRSIHCVLIVLPQFVGDETRHISHGVGVDFIGYPRIGRKPLPVQFEQRCRGAIREFYYTFGDGDHSYYSDPGHLYKKVGIYDVSLRIRIGNRYYTIKKRRYIVVLAGDVIVATTNKALRVAITQEQGIGMYRLPVENMPMPEARVGTLTVIDSTGVARGLILDSATGKWFDITTRNTNTTSKVWLGKDATNEPERYFMLGEDRSTRQNDKLRFIEGRLGIFPILETNRGAVGFDENGFPSGMELKLDAYIDGNPSTPAATMDNIPFDGSLLARGDIKADKRIEGNRIQWKVTVNRGAHIIKQFLRRYIHSGKAAPPDMRISKELDYQEELGAIAMWPMWSGSTLINRRDGAVISISATAAAGMDGYPGSAIRITAPVTLGSITFATLLFWAKGPIAATSGGTALTLVTLGTHVVSGETWTLYYVNTTGSGALVLTPTGSADIFDLRALPVALSANAREYYYTNVANNDGKEVFPI